ncbi:DUF4920 domain-containing protein [Flavimarina sp. Hel_I_48]|uniref:DUF4920 domain-containing protein n=1 Tax=Flavimarina sp. Hel_I_48 TaxID=1392488 RepID=UPI0004DF8D77|nr:DUF4920 domain-containing protein [Flavimarina sp. Hel_I_48]
MKRTIIILAFAALFINCKEKEQQIKTPRDIDLAAVEDEELYGENFNNVKTLSPDQVGDIYNNLKPGDTVNVTFKAPVQAVCKEKGCWMQVDVGTGEPVMVRFKDYGFFVPKNIENKEVTVHGKAFLAEVGVEEQRHLAEDAGKNQAAVEAITQPQRSMGFTADGVKIGE